MLGTGTAVIAAKKNFLRLATDVISQLLYSNNKECLPLFILPSVINNLKG